MGNFKKWNLRRKKFSFDKTEMKIKEYSEEIKKKFSVIDDLRKQF